ncbi:MAG: DUF6152 family protein [Steroidobacteraceae bacterium]
MEGVVRGNNGRGIIMKNSASRAVYGCIALAAVVAGPSLAHHSASMFDMQKQIEVQGTVKEFRWTNPHSWLLLTAPDATNKAAEYNIEMNGPGYLVRNGWKRESLKPGDVVTVTINPLRDGSPGGNLVKVTRADGKELSAQVGGGAPPAAAAPAQASPGEQR